MSSVVFRIKCYLYNFMRKLGIRVDHKFVSCLLDEQRCTADDYWWLFNKVYDVKMHQIILSHHKCPRDLLVHAVIDYHPFGFAHYSAISNQNFDDEAYRLAYFSCRRADVRTFLVSSPNAPDYILIHGAHDSYMSVARAAITNIKDASALYELASKLKDPLVQKTIARNLYTNRATINLLLESEYKQVRDAAITHFSVSDEERVVYYMSS